jgi:hypothetical protein
LISHISPYLSAHLLIFTQEEYNWKTINVGLAMACMLGAAATLEWALGFCLACWMFGLGIQVRAWVLGWVPGEGIHDC